MTFLPEICRSPSAVGGPSFLSRPNSATGACVCACPSPSSDISIFSYITTQVAWLVKGRGRPTSGAYYATKSRSSRKVIQEIGLETPSVRYRSRCETVFGVTDNSHLRFHKGHEYGRRYQACHKRSCRLAGIGTWRVRSLKEIGNGGASNSEVANPNTQVVGR